MQATNYTHRIGCRRYPVFKDAKGRYFVITPKRTKYLYPKADMDTVKGLSVSKRYQTVNNNQMHGIGYS